VLEAPAHGWTQVRIGDFSDRASYLTDVPMECLESFIYGFFSDSPISLKFDAEGWDFLVVVDDYSTHIITSKDNYKLESYEIWKEDLAVELINDIESNLEAWVEWDLDYDDGEKSNSRRKHLISHLERLRELLDEKNYIYI
jgi:hypothetical protein